ncbi:MAG: aminoacetone oxidase family FAD-binding enzyme [Desulfocapsa sp.]|nr:MAG: aminoacetone oxidase family FAD-binding enzyme [Desulfocapsa sp.]
MSEKRVIVVGGGAAGLMAAGQAAENGAEVILLEKMKRPGRKICISGKGRCNLTNSAGIPEFVEHFGKNGRFLRQAFSRFFAPDLLMFFQEKGLAVSLERGGRYFPTSGKASDILNVLQAWLDKLGVSLRTSSPVDRIVFNDDKIEGVKIGKKTIPADAVIIATGGKSYPSTGSTGDGYALAAAAGHTIVPVRPALVPLQIRGGIEPSLVGLEMRNCEIRLLINGKQKRKLFGELHFLKTAIGGPVVLTVSRQAVDALEEGKKVEILLDLKPALDIQKLDKRLIRDFETRHREVLSEVLRGLLPAGLIPLCLQQTAIPAECLAGQIIKKERKKLLHWFKEQRMEVTGHRPFTEAIVTAGGVTLSEVNPQTMESKCVAGLYITGELLDLDGTTGGYNLQAAFSTGWLAGRAAAS